MKLYILNPSCNNRVTFSVPLLFYIFYYLFVLFVLFGPFLLALLYSLNNLDTLPLSFCVLRCKHCIQFFPSLI